MALGPTPLLLRAARVLVDQPPKESYHFFMPGPADPAAPGPTPAPAIAPVAPAPAGLARFRVFSADAQTLGKDWSDHPEPMLPWVPDPAIVAQPGVEGGFWVTVPPYRGYAKPLAGGRVNPHLHPVAALEKIASDLAYEVSLPVPPVALWQRTNATANEPKHHAVSAPPFEQVLRWGEITKVAGVYAAVAPLVVDALSAIVAFDTWLQCEDHAGNPGNLLISTEAGPPAKAHIAPIDYSYSMIHKWRGSYRDNFVAPMYDNTLVANIAVVREAIDAICGVSDHTIDRIVSRLPDPFISATDKARIIEGLEYRRDHLHQTLALVHPGV
jgi:hypothetical protein